MQLSLGLQNRDFRLYKYKEFNKRPPKGKFPGRGGRSSFQLPMDFNYHPIPRLEIHVESVQMTTSGCLSNYVPLASVIFSPLKHVFKPLGFPLPPFRKVFPSIR